MQYYELAEKKFWTRAKPLPALTVGKQFIFAFSFAIQQQRSRKFIGIVSKKLQSEMLSSTKYYEYGLAYQTNLLPVFEEPIGDTREPSEVQFH